MPRHGDARRLLAGVRAGEQGDRHRGSFFRRADDPVGPYLLSLVPPDSPTFRSRNTQYLPGLLDDTSLSSPLCCSHLIFLPVVRLAFLLFSSSLPSLSLAQVGSAALSGAHTTHTYAHTHTRAPHVVSYSLCVLLSFSLRSLFFSTSLSLLLFLSRLRCLRLTRARCSSSPSSSSSSSSSRFAFRPPPLLRLLG